MGIPVRNKGNSTRQSEKTNSIINRGNEQKDPNAIDDAFPNPKIVNSQIGMRHENKSAFAILYDSPGYQAKSEVCFVAGAHGAAQAELTPEGKPVEYGSRNSLDAAQIVLSEATDDTGINSLVGKPNYRSLVGAKADNVKFAGREIVEIAAGGENYLSNGAKNPSVYGGVNIIAGNKTKKGDLSLQPMVKGDDMVQFLTQQIEFIQNLTSVQQAIINDILQLKITLTIFGSALAAGVGPLIFGAVPAAGTALVSAVGVSTPKSAIALSNNMGVDVNHSIFKNNFLEPYSPKYVLSKFNKVN
tara:strand:+ start:3822 stop:4724 length:903 start_codon:yes stop_codon:yes gene_type:complete